MRKPTASARRGLVHLRALGFVTLDDAGDSEEHRRPENEKSDLSAGIDWLNHVLDVTKSLEKK